LTAASLSSDGRVATTLGGTQILFDGVPAPLLYASSGQVAAVAPYSLDGRQGTQVQVRNGALQSDLVALPVTAVAPSIFSADLSGAGPAAILNQDGVSINSTVTPADKGSVISIFATGEGQTNPRGIDGLIATGGNLPQPSLPVHVFIDGREAEVLYAGAAPGAVAGLLQVNARIPMEAPSGSVAVEIRVGNTASQPGMTVAVR
jgi:uncharacterized protein (TIGR03437 family)